ncbi:MAG: hypothetical protein ACUVS7_02285 [Bryobacteraceae bacterium]
MTDPPARSIPQRLVGWRGIARHLGVSVRAAQQWERTRRSPVHRLPGGRGGIHAVTGELDKWAAGEYERLRSARSRGVGERRIIRVALGTAVVVLVAGGGMGGRLWMGRRNSIAALRFEAGALVATDARGVDLWRLTLEPPQPGAKLDANPSLTVLADLHGDGRKEVVVAGGFKAPDAAGQEPVLREGAHLVAPSGNLLWEKMDVPEVAGRGRRGVRPGLEHRRDGGGVRSRKGPRLDGRLPQASVSRDGEGVAARRRFSPIMGTSIRLPVSGVKANCGWRQQKPAARSFEGFWG